MSDILRGHSGAGGSKLDSLSPEGMPLRIFLQWDDSAEHDMHPGQHLQQSALYLSTIHLQIILHMRTVTIVTVHTTHAAAAQCLSGHRQMDWK